MDMVNSCRNHIPKRVTSSHGTDNLWRFRQNSGLPLWCSGKESAWQCRRHRFHPRVGKISWRRKWQPALVFLPENPLGRGACRATAHGAKKSWTRLSAWAQAEFWVGLQDSHTLVYPPMYSFLMSVGETCDSFLIRLCYRSLHLSNCWASHLMPLK